MNEQLDNPLLRASIITVIKGALGIRSASSADQDFKDPLQVTKNKGPTEFGTLTARVDDWEVPVHLTGTTTLMLSAAIEIINLDGKKDREAVKETVEEIVKCVQRLCPIGKKYQDIWIRGNHENIVKESLLVLGGLGYKIPDVRALLPTESLSRYPSIIRGTLNEDNLRAYGYMLLKALLYHGYDKGLLENLIKYVSDNILENRNYVIPVAEVPIASAHNFMSLRHLYHHEIFWNINEKELSGYVSLFSCPISGVRVTFRFPHKVRRSVIADGHIPAQGAMKCTYYENDKVDGEQGVIINFNGRPPGTNSGGTSLIIFPR